jgi:hypothetical protein
VGTAVFVDVAVTVGVGVAVASILAMGMPSCIIHQSIEITPPSSKTPAMM